MTVDPAAASPPEVIEVYEETVEEAFLRRQDYQRALGRTAHEDGPPAISAHGAPPIGWLTRVLLRCAGVDPGLLRSAPHEVASYSSLGGAILLSAAFAGISSAVAVDSAFAESSRWLTGVVSICFGLLTFSIDRMLVTLQISRVLPQRPLRSGAVLLVPRVLLAILLSLVIAEPIVLKVFGPEIRRQVAIQQEQIGRSNDVYSEPAAEVSAQIAELEARLADELRGEGGSGETGDGRLAARIRAEIAALTRLESSLRKEAVRDALSVRGEPSLLAQSQALEAVTAESRRAWYAVLGLRLLFILLPLMPLLFAFWVARRPGAYQLAIAARNRELESRIAGRLTGT